MNMCEPNNQAAIEFLNQWSAEGPWVLTAIQVDRKGIETQTFQKDHDKDLLSWLEKWNGERNIYFHVNPVIKEINTKATREDIKSMDWLHIDIDPRAGENLDSEHQRSLGLLTDNLPKGIPAPTCIIFSGGGYQGFWRLKEPVPINGEESKFEDAKLYNVQLELLFGGDHCHNVDRIMRLPGTINIPDAKKKAKGRSETLAELIEFNKNTHDISEFTKAPPTQRKDDSGFGASASYKVELPPGEIERYEDINILDQWGVPDRLKVIAVQGHHPEQSKEHDNSRSSWVFDFCCNAVRCEVPDEVIFSILTDPGFGISESVLEQKSSSEKYAKRQIERAKEEADDPWLRQMNERHAVIHVFGGRCRVIQEQYDSILDRSHLVAQSFEDLRNRYMNKKVQVASDKDGKPIFMQVGKWWLGHPQRREFDTVVFSPTHETPNSYNLWKGFACDALPGECDKFIHHLKTNICSNNEDYFDYLIKWMAATIQNPDRPGQVAIVLRGGRGTGKSFFANQFGKLFGRHYLQVSNPGHLVGNFNSHLRDVILLFADEAFFAGDKKHQSVLKTLITEETIAIERKGVDIETAPNFIHLIMASNDQHVVPTGGDERRYFVLDVGDEHAQNHDYFMAIDKQMFNGGREALLHYLLNLDLDNFNVRDVPQTDALKEQKLLSLGPDEEWWYQKLSTGDIINDSGWANTIPVNQIVNDYLKQVQRFNVQRRGTETALGRFLKKMCPEIIRTRRSVEIEEITGDGYVKVSKKRVWCYDLPTLKECRDNWDKLYGIQDWQEIDESESKQTEAPF